MSDRVDRTERLLNLVLCLMATATAVSRATIRQAIPGYGDAPSDAAFERMFERDKDELRSMGIPVETVLDVSGEVVGYRIPGDSYVLHPIDFTVEERAAIALAAQVWSGASIAPVPGTALRKLESASASGHDWTPADLRGPVELTAADAALLPLMQAVRDEKVVTFDYRAPADDTVRKRTVSPWGLRSSSGRWFLVGHHHDREAQRTFRLSRMHGPVQVMAAARVPPPEGFEVSRAGLDAGPDEGVRARFRVAPGRAARLRRMAAAQGVLDAFEADTITVELRSLADATAIACAAGVDAVVVEPPEAVAAARAALAVIARAHGDGGS
ncbi:MAG: WYL domain-containing protein [Actinomycetota bacterium]|nr:WYL domain-containing protein [Actinomycetota bacterium]